MTFLTYLISGLALGSVYAIIALGYTMVYGIAKMLNFAHGDIIMAGGYVAFFAFTRFGLPAWACVVLSIVACTLLGVIIERLAYKPLRQASSLSVLITAIGVSYFLQNGSQLLFGSDTKIFPPMLTQGSLNLFGGSLTISYLTLLTIFICLAMEMLPPSDASSPHSTRSRVVFPQPLTPTRPSLSRCCRVRETSLSTVFPPNALDTCCVFSTIIRYPPGFRLLRKKKKKGD